MCYRATGRDIIPTFKKIQENYEIEIKQARNDPNKLIVARKTLLVNKTIILRANDLLENGDKRYIRTSAIFHKAT